jgi:hypothetical protein
LAPDSSISGEDSLRFETFPFPYNFESNRRAYDEFSAVMEVLIEMPLTLTVAMYCLRGQVTSLIRIKYLSRHKKARDHEVMGFCPFNGQRKRPVTGRSTLQFLNRALTVFAADSI